MSIKINKKGKGYGLGFMPEHYPADRVYLDGDTSKTVQDAIIEVTYTETENISINSHDVYSFRVTSLIPNGYIPMSVSVEQSTGGANTHIISSIFKNSGGNWMVAFYNWYTSAISIKPIIHIFCKRL